MTTLNLFLGFLIFIVVVVVVVVRFLLVFSYPNAGQGILSV